MTSMLQLITISTFSIRYETERRAEEKIYSHIMKFYTMDGRPSVGLVIRIVAHRRGDGRDENGRLIWADVHYGTTMLRILDYGHKLRKFEKENLKWQRQLEERNLEVVGLNDRIERLNRDIDVLNGQNSQLERDWSDMRNMLCRNSGIDLTDGDDDPNVRHLPARQEIRNFLRHHREVGVTREQLFQRPQ